MLIHSRDCSILTAVLVVVAVNVNVVVARCSVLVRELNALARVSLS